MAGILSIKIRADATPFERSLKTVGRNITSFAQKSLAVGRGISLGFTAPLMAIGATAVNAAADFDSLERALAGIMGGANAAAGEMSKLKEAAKLPGLGFEEAVRGSVNLQAVGLSADEARKTLIGFGTAIAASGGGAENLASVTRQLTQMISKNRILQEDFGILQENVPLIGDALEKAFGTRNIEAVRDTGIAAKDFNLRLVGALETLPAVQAATGGLRNNMDNFKDSLKFAQVELGKAILKNIDLEGVLKAITNRIESLLIFWGQLSDGTKQLIIDTTKYIAIGGALAWILGQIMSAVGVLTTVLGGLVKFMMTYDKVTKIITVTTGGWITIALAAVAAVASLAYGINQANKPFDDLSKTISASAKEVKNEINLLNQQFGIINSSNTSQKLRSKLITEIYNKYGSYLPDLKDEKDLTNDLAGAQKTLNIELGKKFELIKLQGVAKVQEEKSLELLQKEEDLKIKISKLEGEMFRRNQNILPIYRETFNYFSGLSGGLEDANSELKKTQSESKKIEAAWKKTNEEIQKILDSIPKIAETGNNNNGGDPTTNRILTAYEKLNDELQETELKYKSVVLTQGALSDDAAKLRDRYYELLNALQGVNEEFDKISKRTPLLPQLPERKAPETDEEVFNQIFPSSLQQKIQSITGFKNGQSQSVRDMIKTPASELQGMVNQTTSNAFTADWVKKFDKAKNEVKVGVEELKELNVSLTESLKDMYSNMAFTIGEELGNALAGAGFNIKNVLMPVADALIQFGQLAIKAGVAALGIEAALKSLKGAGAIAAGIGLVALGTFVKSQLKPPKLAKGGLAFGPTMAVVGDNRGASYDPEVIAPLSKLKGMLGDVGFGGVLETRISGNDLVILLNRSQKGLNRIK